MPHLTTESLARLVDEAPTTAEQAHLEICRACRAALDELRLQTVALAALPAMTPPADAWEKILARVEADRIAPIARRPTSGIAMRAVAAVVLFALGTATGAALATRQSASSTTAERGDAGTNTATGTGNAATDASGTGGTMGLSVLTSQTPEVALARLRIAEMIYTSALLDYAALASPRPPRDPVARLATLESIVLTTRTALERAPADPLINSYHLAALAERQTLLGQLRRTPEVGQWY
jgi:hypothetical protein